MNLLSLSDIVEAVPTEPNKAIAVIAVMSVAALIWIISRLLPDRGGRERRKRV